VAPPSRLTTLCGIFRVEQILVKRCITIRQFHREMATHTRLPTASDHEIDYAVRCLEYPWSACRSIVAGADRFTMALAEVERLQAQRKLALDKFVHAEEEEADNTTMADYKKIRQEVDVSVAKMQQIGREIIVTALTERPACRVKLAHPDHLAPNYYESTAREFYFEGNSDYRNYVPFEKYPRTRTDELFNIALDTLPVTMTNIKLAASVASQGQISWFAEFKEMEEEARQTNRKARDIFYERLDAILARANMTSNDVATVHRMTSMYANICFLDRAS
jgi:hypothetical protein